MDIQVKRFVHLMTNVMTLLMNLQNRGIRVPTEVEPGFWIPKQTKIRRIPLKSGRLHTLQGFLKKIYIHVVFKQLGNALKLSMQHHHHVIFVLF